jgi:hypothetical protein
MTTGHIPAQSRIAITLFVCACVALIAIQGWRLLEIVPRWLGGLPPAYPGQYQRRSLDVAIAVGLMGAVLVRQLTGRVSRRAQFAYWSLLAVGAAAFVAQWLTMS